MPIKILNVEPRGYSDEARKILSRAGTVIECECSRAELKMAIRDAHVLILRFGHRIDGEILAQAKELKIIAVAATGVDHIDVEEAHRRGITVVSLKGERKFLDSIYATAELTWGLILAAVRHIPSAAAAVQEGRWQRDPFQGNELFGKTLGIVGYGRIGQKVARYALAFGMKVKVYDPYVPVTDRRIKNVSSLLSLVSGVDILTIHVPLTKETTGLVNRSVFKRLRKGAFLVNTARGAVIEEDALLAALAQGQLGGAALDVVCQEHQPALLKKSKILAYARKHPNLLITPHIGGITRESWEKTEIFIARKIIRVIKKLAE